VPLLSYNLTYQVIGIGDCNESYSEAPISEALSARRTSYEIANLTPWRTYRLFLVAINVAGGGNGAQEVFASADTSKGLEPRHLPCNDLVSIAPTGTVMGVAASNVEARSVTYEWDEMECGERGGVLLYYQVLVWRQEGANQITEANVDVRTGRSHTIKGLVPYTQYGMKVRYVNRVGAGPYSQNLYITTAQDGKKILLLGWGKALPFIIVVPPAPTSLTITEKTDKGIVIAWNAPSPTHGVIVQYKILYVSASDPQVENSIVQDAQSTANSRNITNLAPYTQYTFQASTEQ
jgi:hypothetical protein